MKKKRGKKKLTFKTKLLSELDAHLLGIQVK